MSKNHVYAIMSVSLSAAIIGVAALLNGDSTTAQAALSAPAASVLFIMFFG